MTPRSPFSSGSLLRHLRRGEPDDVEGPGQVDVDDRSEEVERERPVVVLPDYSRRGADARAVHDAVDRVEGVEEPLDGLLVGHVGLRQVGDDRLAAGLLEQARRRSARGPRRPR